MRTRVVLCSSLVMVVSAIGACSYDDDPPADTGGKGGASAGTGGSSAGTVGKGGASGTANGGTTGGTPATAAFRSTLLA